MFACVACGSSSAVAQPLSARRVQEDLGSIVRRGEAHDRCDGFVAVHHAIDRLAGLARTEDLAFAVDLSDARDATAILRGLRKLVAVTSVRRETLPAPLADAREIAVRLIDDARCDPDLRTFIQEALRERVVAQPTHSSPRLRAIDMATATLRRMLDMADASLLPAGLRSEVSSLCDLADAAFVAPARCGEVADRCREISLLISEPVLTARHNADEASFLEY